MIKVSGFKLIENKDAQGKRLMQTILPDDGLRPSSEYDDKRRGLTERQENFYHNLLQLHRLLNFSKKLPIYFTDDEGNNWHLDRGCVKMAVNHGFLDELQDDVAGHLTEINLGWVKD